MNRRKRSVFQRLGGLLLTAALFAALSPPPASALDTGGVPFTPNPKTTYSAEFIAKCDNRQWFMDVVEAALNISARSINTLQSKNDLNQITSLARNSPVDGSLPPAIGEFSRLRFLFLGGVGLTGEIPEELYECAELENLDLSGGSLTGEISSGVTKLTRLKVLLLNGNALEGVIPALPATLTNLDLSDNRLTGGVPTSIGALTQLTVLGLSKNPLKGAIPAQLGALTKLRVLTAWDCGFEGSVPDALGSLTELQVLDLSQNELTGTVPAGFGSLAKLEKLSLAGNKLTGALPGVISGLTDLSVLDLSDNMLDGAIPAVYNNLTKLRILSLDGNRLDGEITDIWGGMADLELCYLRGNRFVGDAPASLVARQTSGADVRLDQNYLRGENTAKIAHNEGNFTSDATQDYQVRLSMDAYTQSPVNAKFNVYSSFTVKRADSGNAIAKAKLPPEGYEVVLKTALDNPSAYFTLTSDSGGIYIQLLQAVPYGEAVEFELRMLPYDADAPYTFVSFKLGTEPKPSGSVGIIDSGGGGGGDKKPEKEPEPEPEPRETVRHTPYITGVGGGRVKPDDFFTREQAAVVLWRILGEPYAKYDSRFPDVDAGRWSADAVEYMYTQGIMQGYPDGRFAPGDDITRAEFAALLVRFKGFSPEETSKFPDALDNWANGYIGAADSHGLMRGYPDGSFGPGDHITRAEVITAVNRMLGRAPDREQILRDYENPYTDLPESHWAYEQIIEATTEHDAVYLNGVEVWEKGGNAQ
jgi:hypothetical protein